jgi:acetyl-CoA carboxylase carboxyl transferase subunit alpha
LYPEQELLTMDSESLLAQRHAKFRKIGEVDESGPVDPHIKRSMKKQDAPLEEGELLMLPPVNGSAPEPLIVTSEASRD